MWEGGGGGSGVHGPVVTFTLLHVPLGATGLTPTQMICLSPSLSLSMSIVCLEVRFVSFTFHHYHFAGEVGLTPRLFGTKHLFLVVT